VIGEMGQLVVERAIGSIHVVGDEHTPLGWAGSRPAECVGRRPQTFTSTARPFVRPVHLEAGPVVRPQNHQLTCTSWLDLGRCTTSAFLGSFVSTVDPLVRVSFCWGYPLSDPRDCGVRIGFGLLIEGPPQGQLASDGGSPKDRSGCLPGAFVPTGSHTRRRGMSRSRVADSATQRSHRSPSDFDGVPRANTDTN
jgi:hypothetical protein